MIDGERREDGKVWDQLSGLWVTEQTKREYEDIREKRRKILGSLDDAQALNDSERRGGC